MMLQKWETSNPKSFTWRKQQENKELISLEPSFSTGHLELTCEICCRYIFQISGTLSVPLYYREIHISNGERKRRNTTRASLAWRAFTLQLLPGTSSAPWDVETFSEQLMHYWSFLTNKQKTLQEIKPIFINHGSLVLHFQLKYLTTG